MKFSLAAATTAAALVGSALAFAQEPKAAAPAAGAAATAPAYPAELKELNDRAAYAIGQNLGTMLKANDVNISADMVLKGLKDGLAGKAALTDEQFRETMTAFQTQLQAKAAETMAKKTAAAKAEGEAFLKANGAKPGIVTLPSGLQYKVIKEGNGPSPKANDSVSVHYAGRLLDGTEFDSSIKRGKPTEFTVNQVIKGWTEALQLMKVGSKWEVYIPSDLAYGANPRPGGPIPPNAVLIFEVELLGVGAEK